jgi:hypothetical protein
MPKEKKARRARVDSKESAVLAFVHAGKKINPPDDIEFSDADSVIFDEIITEFANVDWSRHAVRLACLLARTIADMQEDQKELRDEGSVIQNDRGNYMMNPRRTACQGYATQIIQLRRTLALHATAGSSKGDVGKRRGINKAHQADSPLPSDDEEGDALIATPAAV